MEGRISAKVAGGHPGGPTGSAGFDTSVPNVARIYDYWLGGTENFQSDKTTADHLLRVVPEAKNAARDNRAFLARAVRFLAQQGISQFLDIGAGMPGTVNVHDIALDIHPDARIAYVDYDPIVVSHGRAMLTKSRQAIVVRADLTQPEKVLGNALVRGHFDFGKPIAVLLLAVLHFVSDDANPARILATLRDALAPGSYLVISHVTHDGSPDSQVSRTVDAFAKTSASLWPRSTKEILRLFDGFDLVEPGLVPEHEWHPGPDGPRAGGNNFFLGGVARKA